MSQGGDCLRQVSERGGKDQLDCMASKGNTVPLRKAKSTGKYISGKKRKEMIHNEFKKAQAFSKGIPSDLLLFGVANKCNMSSPQMFA